MIARYRLYRSYGHGRLVAVGNAIPVEVVLISAIVAGAIIGAIY
jgi:hypothetical protein